MTPSLYQTSSPPAMEEYLTLFAMVVLLSLLSLFFIRKLSSPSKSKLNLPPSPTALPIIGHLYLLGPSPHLALHRLSTLLGPIFHLRLGSVQCVVASDADTAKEFLRTHELLFSDRPSSTFVQCMNPGAGGFIFAPYGDYWRFWRKLCVTELLGGRTLERLQRIRREEMRRFFQTLHDKAEKRQDVDLGAELIKLTNNVICQMLMSKRCSGTDGEASEVKKLMEEFSKLMGSFNVGDYIRFCRNLDLQGLKKRTEDLQRRLDRMMEGILKEREDLRRKGDPSCSRGDASDKDLLDMLLDMSEDEGAETRLTRENMKFFLRDIFGAGTDSGAITMEWALAELINHPAILHKAREEIDSVVGASRLVDESDIPSLPFLQAIVKETMRLHPAGPVMSRQSTGQCRVMGYDIPANTTLFVNLWAIGRDPKQWEEPLAFRPERFLEEGRSAGVDVRGQQFQLLPFGSGRRGCPGIAFALQGMQPTLGAMIQCFDWSVEKGVVDMAEGEGLLVPMAHPLVCTAAARLDGLPLP